MEARCWPAVLACFAQRTVDEPLLQHVDDTIHAKARLAIMTILVLEGGATFSRLKQASGLTAGNLGAHLRVLEEAGYIKVKKTFADRKPLTTCRATAAGQDAFSRYLAALEQVFEAARKARP